MAHLVPAYRTDQPDAGKPSRPIERLFPIGHKDGPTTLIAICTDHTVWELDRREQYPMWRKLPGIPMEDA